MNVAGEMDINPGDRTILIVDDLPENIELLRTFLSSLEYGVLSAENGEDALSIMERTPPDLVLLDLMMPIMDGFEVCRRIKSNPATRHIPVIVITGSMDHSSNVHAIEAGADDFLGKPFDRILLNARIKSSLHSKLLQDEILRYQHDLEERVEERTRQVKLTQQVTIFSLAKLAESRDTETGDHLERMRLYAKEIAEELSTHPVYTSIDKQFVEDLYQSSPLHDIGKVGIPDHILLKPGKLTAEEFEIMKTHSVIGGRTLEAADRQAGKDAFLEMGRDIAYSHHEKWDGSGYPLGLAEIQIPLSARIVAIADVYDALTSRRPYKEPFSHETAREIILEGKSKHFEPNIVDAFLTREAKIVDIQRSLSSIREFA